MIPDCVKEKLGEFTERLLTHGFTGHNIDSVFDTWKEVYICTRCKVMIAVEWGDLYYGWEDDPGVSNWVPIKVSNDLYILTCDEAIIKNIIE